MSDVCQCCCNAQLRKPILIVSKVSRDLRARKGSAERLVVLDLSVHLDCQEAWDLLVLVEKKEMQDFRDPVEYPGYRVIQEYEG